MKYKAPDNSLHHLSVSDIARGGEKHLPAGCIAITDEEAEALRLANIPAITPEQVRADRGTRIEAIRWRIERYNDQKAAGIATTDTAAQYALVLEYVQALRDVTLQAGFPTSVNWPAAP